MSEKIDYWTEGYRAALEGQGYADNPYEGTDGGTPWAFGCDQGIRARNSAAFKRIMAEVRDDRAEGL